MAPWGGVFDFNFDGKVSGRERVLGIMIVNRCMESDTNSTWDFPRLGDLFSNPSDYSWRDQYEYDFDTGIDPEDYETEDEFLEALEDAKTAWRDSYCYNPKTGIDPKKYETEEEYLAALAREEASRSVRSNASAPIALSISEAKPSQEALDAIMRWMFPDERSFEAARYLYELEQGTTWLLEDTDAEEEKERCRFILEPPCLAAKYLTAHNGFILAQAVQDHFTLPIEVATEDSKPALFIDDLISEVSEEDPALAVEIWAWCIKEFGPYKKYLHHSWSLYGGILGSLSEYPVEFQSLVVEKLGADPDFSDGVLSNSPDIPYGAIHCIAKALQTQLCQEAQLIFVATLINPLLKGKDMEAIIEDIISNLSNYTELESMERFQEFLMPIIRNISNKRIQRLVPKFQQTIAEYIHSVESTVEKYQYSRRFAWRNTCEDGAPYGLDPLDYETEEAYNQAFQEEKYRWRFWHRKSEPYGLDVNDYETETEYLKAVEEKKAVVWQEQRAQRQSAYADPLLHTDETVYSFCSVMFAGNSRPYHYLTGEINVEIGDQVVVPSSRPEGTSTGTVVSVSKHLRISAPFPVDRAKTILRKL